MYLCKPSPVSRNLSYHLERRSVTRSPAVSDTAPGTLAPDLTVIERDQPSVLPNAVTISCGPVVLPFPELFSAELCFSGPGVGAGEVLGCGDGRPS
jgi:hypothetical protein